MTIRATRNATTSNKPKQGTAQGIPETMEETTAGVYLVSKQSNANMVNPPAIGIGYLSREHIPIGVDQFTAATGAATGADPGYPGAYVPLGIVPPADLAAMIVLDPTTQALPWEKRAWIYTLDGSQVTWDGLAWIAFPPVAATGATEVSGLVGAFTPAGSKAPFDLAQMNAEVIADPLTVWDTDSFMTLGDTSICHWDDSIWVVGAAP